MRALTGFAHALICQRVALPSFSVLAHGAACEGADDEGTGLAGAEDGVGNLCSPGTHANGHGRSKAEGQYGGRNEADRAAADANGGVARQRGGDTEGAGHHLA
jgi:type IV secretory pathway TrbL component